MLHSFLSTARIMASRMPCIGQTTSMGMCCRPQRRVTFSLCHGLTRHEHLSPLWSQRGSTWRHAIAPSWTNVGALVLRETLRRHRARNELPRPVVWGARKSCWTPSSAHWVPLGASLGLGHRVGGRSRTPDALQAGVAQQGSAVARFWVRFARCRTCRSRRRSAGRSTTGPSLARRSQASSWRGRVPPSVTSVLGSQGLQSVPQFLKAPIGLGLRKVNGSL